jgi:protein-S-isoprenylcysteine O-methyltransferase Ste14
MIGLLPGIHIANLAVQTALWFAGNTSPNPPPRKEDGDFKPEEKEWKTVNIGIVAGKITNLVTFGVIGYFIWKKPDISESFPYKTLYAISSGLSIVGGLVRLYCYQKLKHLFTFEIGVKKDHKLIKDGLYKYVRHPSYTGAMLMNFGFAASVILWFTHLANEGVIGTVARNIAFASVGNYPLGILLFAFGRMDKEEQMLKKHFGQEYEDYMKSTKRLIPYVY